MMKMMTSHFAIDIDIPAMPLTPSRAKIIASIKKRIARLIRSAISVSLPIASRR
jgi:hypothetical protein